MLERALVLAPSFARIGLEVTQHVGLAKREQLRRASAQLDATQRVEGLKQRAGVVAALGELCH